jgi:phosphoglycerol transferase MdoB-like AlkP superfamily enzyme
MNIVMTLATFLLLGLSELFLLLTLKKEAHKKSTIHQEQLLISSLLSLFVILLSMVHIIVAVVILFILYTLYYANMLNARFFGEVIKPYQLGLFLTSPTTVKNNVNLFFKSTKELVKTVDIFIGSLFFFNCAVLIYIAQEYKTELDVVLIILNIMLGLSILKLLFSKKKYQHVSFAIAFEYYGLIFLYVAELFKQGVDGNKKSRDNLSDKKLSEKWNVKKNNNETNELSSVPFFGALKGKNIVLIQLESFQEFLIGKKVNEENEITPFLNQLVKKSIYFDNIYAQYGMGHTSDVELVILNSLYPLKDEIVNLKHFDKDFQALPKILKEKGYHSTAFHGFKGEYYNRKTMFQTYGFDQFYAENDYDLDEKIGLGLSDHSFFQQSIKKMKNLKKPFFSLIISLTSHFPFDLPARLSKLPKDVSNGSMLNQYFQSVHYTDQAIQSFFESMEQEGLIDNTAVILYGDHEGVPLNHVDSLIRYLGLDERKRTYNDIILRKVPFLIYAKDLAEPGEGHIPNSVLGSTLDLAPTLLSLLGIPPATYHFGQNLFAPSKEYIPLSSFPKGTFITRDYVYVASDTGEVIEKGSLFDKITGENIAIDKGPQVSRWYKEVVEELSISEKLIKENRIKDVVQMNPIGTTGAEDKSQQRGSFELDVELHQALNRMEADSIVLPFTYAMDNIQKEAVELNDHNNWYAKQWEEFYRENQLTLHYFFQLDLLQNQKKVYFKDSAYIPHFRKERYKIKPILGETIFDLLDSIQDNSLIFISVKDEGSQALVPDVHEKLSNIGITKYNNQFLWFSYINMMIKRDGGYTSLMEVAEEAPLEYSFRCDQLIGEFLLPMDVYLLSASSRHGNDSKIMLGDVDYSRKMRGMNIVIYNLEQNKVKSTTFVDTFTTIYTENTVYVAEKEETN